jgi:hypothetical protein
MGVEGTAPREQAAVEQDSKVPAADAAAGAQQTDTLLLDAQIAEGLNNIDVIRYLSHSRWLLPSHAFLPTQQLYTCMCPILTPLFLVQGV